MLPGGKHDRNSCLACKEGSEAAGANNNGLPSLPCYLPNNFVPSYEGCEGTPSHVFPVQLGEMTGKFDSKVENTLSILLRLMKKMMMDNHPLWTHCRSAYATLWNGLKGAREKIWFNRVVYLDCYFEVSNVSSFRFEYFEALKFMNKIEEIDEIFEINGIVEVGPYKPFEIIKILFGILGKAQSEFNKMGYEHTNKGPKPPVELKDKIESVSEFHEMWKSVLELLSGRLASIEYLYKAACYGNLNKPFWERFLNMEQKWAESKRLEKCENCDFCGHRGGQRHRCITCHTKLYCGKECYDADQEVHKEFCKPYDEMMPWKVKEGFSGRRNDKMKKGEEDDKLNDKVFSKMQDLLKKM